MPLSPAYKFFIFLESTMPSAVTLIVVGQYKKADVKFLSGMIFYTHLAGIITIPLALYLFERMMPGF
jgi:predicted permease